MRLRLICRGHLIGHEADQVLEPLHSILERLLVKDIIGPSFSFATFINAFCLGERKVVVIIHSSAYSLAGTHNYYKAVGHRI